MANVKISELPVLNAVAGDDYLIVNDTSTNTTCKMTLNNTNRAFTGSLPLADGLSANTNDGRIQYTITYLSPFFAYLNLNFSDVTITNSTANNLQISVKCSNIAGSPISLVNMEYVIPDTSITNLQDMGVCYAGAGGGSISLWFKSAYKNPTANTVSNTNVRAIVPANSSYIARNYSNIRMLVMTHNPYTDINTP